MKLFNLFTTLAFLVSAIFVAGVPVTNEISFPKKVNDENGSCIFASTPVESDEGYEGYVLQDYQLKNCKYHIDDKRVYCNFTEIDTKKRYTVIFKTSVLKSCSISPKTTFKYVNTLDKSGDYNQYALEYSRDENFKVNGIEVGINKFVFKTNDNCKYELKVKGAIMKTTTSK